MSEPDEPRESVPGGSPDDDDSPSGSAWAQWTGAGFEFGASVLLFFFLGALLDDKWGTAPWMRVAGSALGVVVGTYLLVRPALRSGPTGDRPRNLKRP